MKVIIVFLLMIFCAIGASQADENRLDLANIDQNLRLDIQDKATRPVVTESYDYYEILGVDEKAMRRQMTRNGTKWDDGKTYDSVTTWNINWDYDYNCTSEGCTPDAFSSTVRITFRYPKWIAMESAPQSLRDKWDSYLNNLVLHENGHRDRAVQAAEELSRAVSELPALPTRTELDRHVKRLSKKLMAKLATDQKEYDAVTNHGATQGAVFP